jgi:hypothetical protein
MVEVQQKISSSKIEDCASAIRDELRKKTLHDRIKPDWRIAITAGSRGIAHYSKILATVVDEVKRAGGKPFLVPAMGSHGGATPEGQIQVLKSLGITSETIGASIHSSMEVDEIGRLYNNAPVYVDRIALKADGIIVVGRVKPHTDFKGKIESGLMKMMAIGLGKQKGAETIHWYQSEGYHKLIPAAAKLIMKKAPILLGLAVVENAYHEIAIVKAFESDEIEQEEMKLLEKAKELLARLPLKAIDLLIIEEIGKDISGEGMDTNVTGRFWLPGESDPKTPKIKKIVVLDLSEGTHGNAIGIGLADITTKRVMSKIDYDATFVNSLTEGATETAKIPIFLPNDRDAIATALRTCGPIEPRKAKIVRIKNTLELQRFCISESLAEIVKSNKKLLEKIEFLSEPRKMQFDVLGTLAR